MRAAGAVLVGKGNTNEFAYGIDGLNPHHGDGRNPHDPARVSGGSSSGPAIATAAGMALGALGTDTTGSIRAPSSLCGLVGIRPTLGRVPRSGVIPLAWTYDVVGPLARTVEDAAILLGVLAGHDPADPVSSTAPVPAFDPGHEPSVRGLRLGLVEDLLEVADPPVADGVRGRARSGSTTLGAEVVELRFDLLRHADADPPPDPDGRGRAGPRARGSRTSAIATRTASATGSRPASSSPPRATCRRSRPAGC